MTSTPTDTVNQTAPATDAPPPAPNGMTNEQKRLLFAAAGRHKNNRDYIEQGREQIAEYRKQLQEELERELTDEGK